MPSLQEMFDVSGKSVIVTGGASGIGRAYAEIMAEHAARVCIFDIDQSGLDETVAAIREAGGDAWSQPIDVSDRPAMAEAFDKVASEHGRIDVVFANAGIDAGPGFLTPEGERNPDGAIDNLDDDHWDKVIAVNLSSVYTTIKNAARHMKKTGGGRIIVTSSVAAQINEAIVGLPYMPAQGRGRSSGAQHRDGTRHVRHSRQLHFAGPLHDQYSRRTVEESGRSRGPSRRSRCSAGSAIRKTSRGSPFFWPRLLRPM